MSVSKYDLLEALIDAQVEAQEDPAGWHNVVASVVRIIAEAHGGEEELADAIYEHIAQVVMPEAKESNEDTVDKT